MFPHNPKWQCVLEVLIHSECLGVRIHYARNSYWHVLSVLKYLLIKVTLIATVTEKRQFCAWQSRITKWWCKDNIRRTNEGDCVSPDSHGWDKLWCAQQLSGFDFRQNELLHISFSWNTTSRRTPNIEQPCLRKSHMSVLFKSFIVFWPHSISQCGHQMIRYKIIYWKKNNLSG